MLAQAYIAAKNDDNAIPVLIRASTIADTGKFDASLAQAYLNLEQWQLASDSADQAIKRGGVERLGNMYLIKGMAFFNLARFDQSLSAFTQAQKLPESEKTAKQWYNYVEREQGAQQRLAMLNKI
jgi:tetratricopeptide (TPR) repeat protein